jgi:hypothetical protein
MSTAALLFRRLRRTSDADQVALGIGEVAYHESRRGCGRSQLARPSEVLGLLERGLDVRNRDIKGCAAMVALAAADAARDPDVVAGRVAVHEPVVTRL